MKAMVIEEFMSSPVLREMPSPVLADGEVLVDVAAFSLNTIDLRIAEGMIQGRLPYELPITLGQDLSGTVVTTGAGVTSLAVGDAVFGVHFKIPFHAGTWAEQVAIPATQLVP